MTNSMTKPKPITVCLIETIYLCLKGGMEYCFFYFWNSIRKSFLVEKTKITSRRCKHVSELNG